MRRKGRWGMVRVRRRKRWVLVQKQILKLKIPLQTTYHHQPKIPLQMSNHRKKSQKSSPPKKPPLQPKPKSKDSRTKPKLKLGCRVKLLLRIRPMLKSWQKWMLLRRK
jgi:hypothetical protein